MKTPCWKCLDRHEACWDTCSVYIEWRKERDKVIALEKAPRYIIKPIPNKRKQFTK